MNHLNNQISALGKSIASALLGPATVAQVYTKRHQVVEGLEMTGMNVEQLDKLRKKAGTNPYLVFVDSKMGLVYGQRLQRLMDIKEFYGIKFPYYKAAIGGGRIIMWPVHKMDTIGRIQDTDLKQLIKLQADNKSDAQQTSLF